MSLELRPHQLEAISKMHNGCVLWGGVGTGKTITALAYAKQMEPDRPVVVITTAKVRDSLSWEKEAAKLFYKEHEIIVSSWNKINNFTTLSGCFFIFDEQRLVGTGAWVKAFYKIAEANKWILLSATPGDTWSDYAPMFIANGWYKNITEFRREHAIYSRFSKYPKIERWINEGRLQKYRKQLLVQMPMERHTVRHVKYVECDYDSTLLDIVRKKRWNIYKDEPIRNAAELFSVMRKVVSTDPSRAEAVRGLLEDHPKLIVFYNYNYELDILRNLCSTIQADKGLLDGESDLTSLDWVFKWAEWNGHKHEDIPKSDSWIYLVQYQSGSEGWNCIETDAMAFWSLTYSWKQFHQAQGRIDRLNTEFVDLNYYVLLTNSMAEKPVMAALNAKHDFQPR